MIRQKPEFRARLLDYLTRHRPVDATFIGLHEADHALPDLSEAGRVMALADLEDLEKSLDEVPSSPDRWVELDRLLIRGFVRIQRWEHEARHTWRGNPGYYTGEAIFGIMSLFLTPFAPLESRVESATARLRAFPTLLEQARGNLRNSPRPWRERALREVSGGLVFLGEGLSRIDLPARNRDELMKAAGAASKALAAFGDWLQDLPLPEAPEDCGCGEEGLELLLREGHFLHLAGWERSSILEYGEEEFEQARRQLDDRSRQLGGRPGELLGSLAGIHPAEDGYYERFQEIWRQSRERAIQRKLLHWPDFPIRFVPRPPWARKAAPRLYFLFYRSPAAFGAPTPHEYLVEGIDPDLSPEDRRKILRRHNDSVIKLNHVLHHGGIGHHIQNWHASRSPSLVGRIAAVDCASRIALPCGGTMAEGWACYATDLMREAEFLSPLEELSEIQSRVRMCARTLVDIRLHERRITLAEAIRFYREETGMAPSAAEGEAVKNSLFPGTGLMYLMGADTIRRLRREMAALAGDRFELGRFHDRLLSFGSLPVALIRQEMLRTGSMPPRFPEGAA